MGTFITIVVALAVLVSAVVRATRRVATARGRVATLRNRHKSQADRIRKLARQTLALRRELRIADHRLEALDRDCRDETAKLAEIEARDRRLIVLDDRHLPTDRGWIVTVRHPRFAEQINSRSQPAAIEAWRTGRRFLIWAADEKRAMEKILARHPESKGFAVPSIVESPAER